MEKSIETIWKNGFLENDTLIAPKINSLYNQKSITLIEKLKRMMKINTTLIIVFAFVNLAIYTAVGTPYAGLFIFSLLIGVYWKSNKRQKSMKNINLGESSYEYLITFNNWIKTGISNNAKTMRFFYPLTFIGALMPIIYALKKGEVTRNAILNSGFDVIYGIPTLLWIIVLLITVLMFVFGERIYKWDVNMFFGKTFKKLDIMISDMEELRS